MARFITLTAAEAAKVRGKTSAGHALDPVPLADGVTYILPLSVLTDPAHAAFLAAKRAQVDVALAGRLREIADNEFKTE